MSKQNSERFDYDLEASNTFTLKGEEETQIEQSTKLEIETNKRHQKASNSHSSIVINNLTNYSFGFSEHILNSEENDINESKMDIIGTFKKNKSNMTPKSRKCDSVVKITLTKLRKSQKAKRLAKEASNSQKITKDPNISDKAIENLNESTSNNKEEISEENKMELENEIKKDEKDEKEKEKEKEFNNMKENILDELIDMNSENEECDIKKKEDNDVNNNIQEEIKDKSSDMFIEPEKIDLFNQEKEKKEENEVISQ